MVKKLINSVIIKIVLATVMLFILFRLTLFLIPYNDLSEFLDSPYSQVVTDRNGVILQVLPLTGGERREFISFENIPKMSKMFFISSEDKRFYYHFGFDLISFCRALYTNIKNKTIVSGASTISMQLSRIVSPQKKSISGKFFEIINALRIESKLSKNKILELYLNSIPFGFNAVGVESGSKTFFNKSFLHLTPEELIILSIIPRSPQKFNPLTSKEECIKLALETRKRIKFQTSEEEIIKSVRDAKSYNYEFNANHFVNFIKSDVVKEKKNIVNTSLDLKLNEYIQNSMRQHIDGYKQNRLTNGAVIVFDNITGEIVAYIGSKDFFDKSHSGEIDGIQVKNQPGSTLKPFLYALAIDKFNFLPSTILPDIISNFGGEEVYIPKNFNNRYNGPVRLRVALASSLNVPAVHTVTRIGVRNFVDLLIKLDFDSIANSKRSYGSGIAVGNAEVSLYELSRAFSIFVRNGKKLTLTYLKHDKREFKDGEKIFSDYTNFIVADILSDQKSRTLGFGSTTIFDTPFQAIFKTGTSNQFNNLWALGATRDYTVGVWMGNFSGETVIGASGSSIPLLLCVEVLKSLNKNKKITRFVAPKGVKKELICALSGKLLTENCNGGIYEYFNDEATLEKCNFHIKENGKVKLMLPPIYSNYIRKMENYDFSFSEYNEKVKILFPNNNAKYFFDSTFTSEEQAIFFEIFSINKNGVVDIYINNSFYKSLKFPFSFFFPLERGKYKIDAVSKNDRDSINIEVK
ncbi:MAG TPA: transglycosylase domain-containing protein [Spirochaetota bacterium]|nr:transglycosylase domain-containing protein [Spirochaetota bacterium]